MKNSEKLFTKKPFCGKVICVKKSMEVLKWKKNSRMLFLEQF